MTQFEMAVKVEKILENSIPRLISLAKRGLPCEKLAESIKSETIGIIRDTSKNYTWEDVREACMQVAGIDRKKFESKGRYTAQLKARHTFAFICNRDKLLSLAEISRVCGGRDHTTAISGIKRFKNLFETEDRQITDFYNSVMDLLTR